MLQTDNQGDGAASHLMLLTGPNMGGKSTLMRQVGLIAILSQLVSISSHTLITISHSSCMLCVVGVGIEPWLCALIFLTLCTQHSSEPSKLNFTNEKLNSLQRFNMGFQFSSVMFVSGS